MGTILKTELLKKYYGTGENQVRALDGIDLSIEDGEFIAVVGTSGSGKSTLLHMLGGLDRPTSGKVYVDGKDIFSLKDDALCVFRRRKIGFVFQSYNLVPVLNVEENICLPIELDGGKADRSYIREIEEVLGIENKRKSLPGQLSGGQQRVAIARALAAKPAIVLADEPTGNLDSRTSQDVLGLLKVTGNQFKQTIVMITHNEEIAQMADRIIRIEDGKILERRGSNEGKKKSSHQKTVASGAGSEKEEKYHQRSCYRADHCFIHSGVHHWRKYDQKYQGKYDDPGWVQCTCRNGATDKRAVRYCVKGSENTWCFL